MIKLVLLLLTTLCARSLAFIELKDFMPYGTDVGDTDLGKSGQTHNLDDGSSLPQDLDQPFTFWGVVRDKLWVNINGAVSFNKAIATYTPICAALEHDMSMIAPYWADVDIRQRGTIYYRQTADKVVLDKVQADVLQAFSDRASEIGPMKWALVATWLDVPFYDDLSCKANLTNTFQLTLAKDARHSYAIFYYNKIEWTTGTASGSNGCTGRGGRPARAGFDGGKGVMRALGGSCTDNIINLAAETDGPLPLGKFVFIVDEENIIIPGTNTPTLPIINTTPNGTTTSSPTDSTTPSTTITTTEPPTPSPPTASPTPDYKTHYDHTKHDLEDLNDKFAHLCPGLIQRPALQDECFEMWKKLSNLIDELYLARLNDELTQIDLELQYIASVFKRIEDDVNA